MSNIANGIGGTVGGLGTTTSSGTSFNIYDGTTYTGYASTNWAQYDISNYLKGLYPALRDEGRKQMESSGHSIDTINKMLEGTKDDVSLALSILKQYTTYLGRFQEALRDGKFQVADGILMEYYTKNLYKI